MADFLPCLRLMRETAEDQQRVGSLKLCFKKIIALPLNEDIALTLDS